MSRHEFWANFNKWAGPIKDEQALKLESMLVQWAYKSNNIKNYKPLLGAILVVKEDVVVVVVVGVKIFFEYCLLLLFAQIWYKYIKSKTDTYLNI